MMNCIFFDDATWQDLLPLTFTRPVSNVRVGIVTIQEKWAMYLPEAHFSNWTFEPYLQAKFPLHTETQNFYINGKCWPDTDFVNAILNLPHHTALVKDGHLLAFNGHLKNREQLNDLVLSGQVYANAVQLILYPWDIFQKNGAAIEHDFKHITANRKSQVLSTSVTVIGDKHKVFLEEGACCEAAILNTTSGSIYIGQKAEIMEGSVIRGPFALCEHSATKLATKIYGPTTIGPHSKVGGEINNSVIFGYSNKAHDGFLGNSVLGEWCNLGADTNTSNLKNNYASVKIYNYRQQQMLNSHLQFCGLIMGDHSKTGINTMLNTGTVVGVGCNLFGADFPPTHVPSFSWGGASAMYPYQFDKFIETATQVYQRRGIALSATEHQLLWHLCQASLSA